MSAHAKALTMPLWRVRIRRHGEADRNYLIVALSHERALEWCDKQAAALGIPRLRFRRSAVQA